MISRVLVANRGEIAVRVIRACHDVGLEAVVVYSEPDAGSLATELADRAIALSGALPADTYLDVERLLGAAAEGGCDAVPSTPASPARSRRQG
jgi:acetyl-CoA/propionyl-CoA carboxylase biotin carboxyl carrier protein